MLLSQDLLLVRLFEVPSPDLQDAARLDEDASGLDVLWLITSINAVKNETIILNT